MKPLPLFLVLFLAAAPVGLRASGAPAADTSFMGHSNDLQARPVEARAGVHTLAVQAAGYEPTSVLVRVVRDWTTRVRLTLIPAR